MTAQEYETVKVELEDNCCGTLEHPDHVKNTDAALQKALKQK